MGSLLLGIWYICAPLPKEITLHIFLVEQEALAILSQFAEMASNASVKSNQFLEWYQHSSNNFVTIFILQG